MPSSLIASPDSRTLSGSARARQLFLALAVIAIAIAIGIALLPPDRRAAGERDATPATDPPTMFGDPTVGKGNAVGRLPAKVGARLKFFNDPRVVKGARGAPLP